MNSSNKIKEIMVQPSSSSLSRGEPYQETNASSLSNTSSGSGKSSSGNANSLINTVSTGASNSHTVKKNIPMSSSSSSSSSSSESSSRPSLSLQSPPPILLPAKNTLVTDTSSVSGDSTVNRQNPSNVIQTTGSLNTTLSRKAAIPRRHLYRHYGRSESKVNIFTLAFQNTMLEKEYRSFMLIKGTKRTIWACVAFLVCLIFFGVYEYYLGISGTGKAQFYIMLVRIITAALPFLYIVLAAPSWRPMALHDYMGTNVLETFMGTNFAVHGILLVIAGSIGSYYNLTNFYPFAWWTSAYDLVHCAVTQLSGARFPVAASVALTHPVLLCINYIFEGNTASLEGNIDQLLLLFACIISCLLVAYRREHIERKEFVSLLNVSADKRMREELLSEMLPQKVKEMLQDQNSDQHPRQSSSRRLLQNTNSNNNSNNNNSNITNNGNSNENDADMAALRNLSVPLLVHIRAQFGRRSLNKAGRNSTANKLGGSASVSPNSGTNKGTSNTNELRRDGPTGGSMYANNRHPSSFYDRVSENPNNAPSNDNERGVKAGGSAYSLNGMQGSTIFDGADEDTNQYGNRRSSTSSETGENNTSSNNHHNPSGDTTHRIMNQDEERSTQRVRRTRTIRFAKRSSVLMDTVLASNLFVNGIRRASTEEAGGVNASMLVSSNEEQTGIVNNGNTNSPNLPKMNTNPSNGLLNNINSFHIAPPVDSISGKLASAQFGGRSVSVPRTTVGLGENTSSIVSFSSAASSSSSSASNGGFTSGRPPSATKNPPSNRSQSVDPSARSGRGSILINAGNNAVRGNGKRISIESSISIESNSDKSQYTLGGDTRDPRRGSDGIGSRVLNGINSMTKSTGGNSSEGYVSQTDNSYNNSGLKIETLSTPINKGLHRYHRSSTDGYQSFWSPDGKDVHAFSEEDVSEYQTASASSSSSVDVSAHTGTVITPKVSKTVSAKYISDDTILELSPGSGMKIGEETIVPSNKSSPLTLNLGNNIDESVLLPGTVSNQRKSDSAASSPTNLPSSPVSGGSSTGRSVRGLRELSGTARIITGTGMSEKAANWRSLRGSIVGEIMLPNSPKGKEINNQSDSLPGNMVNIANNKAGDAKITKSLSSQGSARSFFGSSAWSFLQAPLSFRSDNNTNRSNDGPSSIVYNNRSSHNMLNSTPATNTTTTNGPPNPLVRGPSISNVFRKLRRDSRDSVHSDLNSNGMDINMLRRSSTASGTGSATNDGFPFNANNIGGSAYYNANASGVVPPRYNIDGLDDNNNSDQAVGHNFSSVTVMFVYITNLSRLATKADPLELVTFLNGLYTEFDAIVDEIGVYKVMAIANMYMCVAGALDENEDHAATMADTALAIMKLVKKYRSQLYLAGEPVRIQIGLHSGEAAGGIIGFKTFNWHIFGDTVNTASRMCSNNDPGRIQVSPVTAEMIHEANKARSSSGNSAPVDHVTIPLTNDSTINSSSTLTTNNAPISKYILRERGLIKFKGKGDILTSWLTDNELMELDSLDAKIDEVEKAERLRVRQLEQKLLDIQHQQLFDEEELLNSQNTSDHANFVAKLRNLFGSTNPQSFTANINTSTGSTKKRIVSGPFSATQQRGQIQHRHPILDTVDDTTVLEEKQASIVTKVERTVPVRARRSSLDGGRRGSNMQTHNGVIGALVALDPLHRLNGGQNIAPRRTSSNQTRRRSSLEIFSEENVAKLREKENHKPSHAVVPIAPPIVVVVESSTSTDTVKSDHGDSSDVHVPSTPKELQSVSNQVPPSIVLSPVKNNNEYDHHQLQSVAEENTVSLTTDTLNGSSKLSFPKAENDTVHNSVANVNTKVKLQDTNKKGTLKGSNLFSTDSKSTSTALVPSSTPLFGTSMQVSKAPFTSLRGKSVVEVDAASQRDRLVTLVEQPKHWLTLTFSDPFLESRFQRRSLSELNIQLLRGFFFGTLVALGALLKLDVFDDPSLYNAEQFSALQLSRVTLLSVCGVCTLLMLINCPGRMMNSLIYIRLFPWARYFPPHEQLSVLLCFAYSACLNAELYPISEWSSSSRNGLANLNFVLLLTFSFLELRAYVLMIVNALCWGVYTGLLLSSQLETDEDIGAHIFLAATAAVFSCMTAYVREMSRRNRFTVQEQATRQRDRCEKLLLNMLPSQEHAEALMRGEHVVEVLEDVTMLYSDIKGFTELSAKLHPEELIKFLDHLYTAFDQHLDHFGLYKIETIGDAFIVVGGMKHQGEKSTPRNDNGTGNGRNNGKDASRRSSTTPVSSPEKQSSRRRSSLATFMTPAELLGWKSGTTMDSSSETDSHVPKSSVTPAIAEEKHAKRVSFISRILRSRGMEYPPPPPPKSRSTATTSNPKDAPRLFTFGSPSKVAPLPLSMVHEEKHEHHNIDDDSSTDNHYPLSSINGQRAVSTSLLMKRSMESISTARSHTSSAHAIDASLSTISGENHTSATTDQYNSDHSTTVDSSAPRVSLSALAASGFSTEVAMAAERKQARRASFLGGTGRATLLRTIMEGNSSVSRNNTLHTANNEYTSEHTKTMTETTLVTERSYDDLLRPSIVPVHPATTSALLASHSSFYSTTGPMAVEPLNEEDPLKPPPLYPTGRQTEPMSHAGAIAAFAMDMLAEVRRVRERTGVPVYLRVGIHSGKAVGGIIGKTRPRFFIWGADTLIANKMESSGVVGGIQVSEVTAKRLVEEGFTLVPHQIVDVSPESDHHGGSDNHEEDNSLIADSIHNPPPQTVNTYLLVRYTDPSGMAFEVSNV